MRKHNRVGREVVEGMLKKFPIAERRWQGGTIDIAGSQSRLDGVRERGKSVLRADEADASVYMKEKKGTKP